MATIIEKLSNLSRNKDLFNTFIYLYERWQDEEEYEDWNDYAKAMKQAVEVNGSLKGIVILGATQEPFGLKFSYKGNYVKLYLKFTETKVQFICEIGNQ